jgi:hypothetical protein
VGEKGEKVVITNENYFFGNESIMLQNGVLALLEKMFLQKLF